MYRSIVLVWLLAVACAQPPVEELLPELYGPRPPRSTDEIELIEGNPERPYAVLGVWEANVDDPFDDQANRFRDRMVAQAAQMGADAVVFAVSEEEIPIDPNFPNRRRPPPISKVRAAIIVWIASEREPVIRAVT
jgi:hypothetical protein